MTLRGTLALLALAVAVAAASAAEGQAPTLKDLRRPPPEIRAGEQAPPNAERARELYRGFLELDAGDAALRTEALRRLGDLELDAGEAARGEATVPGAGSAETRTAIAIYSRLLAEQPDFPRADAVLYQLSRAWEAEGDPEKALAYLDQLVARFPGSRRIDEAQFRRGEILFSAQRWRDAEIAYAAVTGTGPASEFYEQAFYKLGWALFKQSATDRSAQAFLALLDTKLNDPRAADGTVALENLPRAERELVADIFRALAIQFAALDAGSSLDAAMSSHGTAPYGWLLYATLGDMLVEKERFTDAADTYRAFVQREPAHRRAPGLQERAIDAYLKGGFPELALEGKREFIRQYRFGGAFWRGRNRAEAPEVVTELKSNLQDVARYHHALAQASARREDYQQAAGWYRQYLESFPDDSDSAGINYLLAEALYESQDYRAATLEYERTAYAYPTGGQSDKAGYAALVSHDKHEAQLAGDALAEWHHAGVEASLRFADTFPQHPEAGRVRLRAAQQLFNLGDHERAATVATVAAMHIPPLGPAELRTAWNVVADSAFELGRYAQAEQAYDTVLARMLPDDAGRATISERLAAAVYKQGEARQAAGDADGAIADFLRISMLAPNSPIRATAEFDAAALLIREKQWERAIPVLEAFRRDYPENPLTSSVPKSLALAYGETGQSIEAAVEFDRIAEAAGEGDDVRRAALLEAAGLYEREGDMPRAMAAWSRFVERYPRPLDDAMSARLKLADMARAARDAAGRTRWLREIVAVDAAASATRSESSRLLAARASLELATPARLAFESIALETPLSRSLKLKRAAMEKALAAYQAAADYGIAEVSTTATFSTAELYRRLAADLLASERPRNLKGDELEQYELLLEEQAYPFEERAIELHEANAARAAEGIYDASVGNSFAALAELKPARYAKQELPAAAAAEGALAEALAAARSDDWAAAEPAFGRALEAGGGAPAMTGLGLAYRSTGRFALAEQAYRSALVANPAYGPAMLNLGVLLDLYLQQPAAALEQYEGYQATLAEPDARVTNWIREVEIRAGRSAERSGASP